MLDRLSVPRRALDFEDYVDILRRNLGWILGPILLGLVVSTVIAYSMEDTFVSSAMLRIVPQQISQKLVQNVTSQELSDHIAAMAQTIKSRNTLKNLITAHHLYQKELKGEPVDDVLGEMSSAIEIRPVSGVLNVSGQTLPALQVSFSYRNKYKAQAVTSDIVTRFMNQNTQEANALTDSTTEFIQDRFKSAKQQLNQVEQKLADYSQKHIGQLPDDMQLNMSQMNALESQLGSLNAALTNNHEQYMMLESNLASAQDRLNAIQSPAEQKHDQHLAQMGQEIQQLQATIASMKNRFTEQYPDLQAAEQQLALLQKQRKHYAQQKASDSHADGDSDVSQARLGARAQVNSIQTQLKANAINKKIIENHIQDTRNALGAYQNRLAGIPAGEREYSNLIHQRDLDQQHYNDLQQKLNLAEASSALQQRNQGQSLELIDSASLPDKPTQPNREKIIPIGAVAGLFIGLVLVAIREIKDTSLKNLKDARLYTQLPILGSVPLLENDLVVQRRKQVMWVGWATATLAGVAIIAGSVAHYYLSKA
ncbi:MAG: GumC family protein [Bryobacteraceae bacterium]